MANLRSMRNKCATQGLPLSTTHSPKYIDNNFESKQLALGRLISLAAAAAVATLTQMRFIKSSIIYCCIAYTYSCLGICECSIYVLMYVRVRSYLKRLICVCVRTYIKRIGEHRGPKNIEYIFKDKTAPMRSEIR